MTNELYERAVGFLPKYGETGILISDLQRRFHEGYSTCAKVMEELEQNGYVSEYNGGTPRRILKTEASL